VGGGVAFVVNGVKYNAEKMFDLVINGGLFHFDDALAGTWDGLDPMNRGMMRATVNALITDCVEIAHAERNLIEEALRRGQVDLS
jgi:hypothetical protein